MSSTVIIEQSIRELVKAMYEDMLFRPYQGQCEEQIQKLAVALNMQSQAMTFPPKP